MTIIPPKREVSPRQLRDMFNERNYAAKVANGELRTRLLKDRHPSAPKADVPYCTRSQSIAYLDASGDEVALVHQYLKPDGTLGGSGIPDPKRVLVDGILYIAWWS